LIKNVLLWTHTGCIASSADPNVGTAVRWLKVCAFMLMNSK
jgi:hypothetical protein